MQAALCDTWQQHGARTDPRYQDAATYIEKTFCNKTLVLLPLRAIKRSLALNRKRCKTYNAHAVSGARLVKLDHVYKQYTQ